MDPQTQSISIGRTSLIAGLLTALSLIIYFMIMRAMQLTGSAVAWGFNIVILFSGIYFCYRYYRMRTVLNVDYLLGMMLGTAVTAVSTVAFTFFVYFYFSSIDPALLSSLHGNILFMSDAVTPLRAASATFIEGLSSGIVISFAMMQYYKSGFMRMGDEPRAEG